MERVILHCDLNNFYASVECRKNPAYRLVPFAVGGREEERKGIILAKNELAKKAGIATGEPIWQAKRKCPDLVVAPLCFADYMEASREVRKIYGRFTDQVEPFGIDECWLDVTGSTELFGSGKVIADTLRETVKTEQDLTISVGVSFNKIFAKLGSDLKKPDGVTVVERQNFREKIWPLPANQLLGVGQATSEKLSKIGVFTIGEIAKTHRDILKSILGKNGETLWLAANGLLYTPVLREGEAVPMKSISRSVTTPKDLQNKDDIWEQLLALSEEVAGEMRRQHVKARGIVLYVKDNQFSRREYQQKYQFATNLAREISICAMNLFRHYFRWNHPVRSIGIGVYEFLPDQTGQQLDLEGKVKEQIKWEALETCMDTLRNRYGDAILQRATLLGKKVAHGWKEENMVLPKGPFL